MPTIDHAAAEALERELREWEPALDLHHRDDRNYCTECSRRYPCDTVRQWASIKRAADFIRDALAEAQEAQDRRLLTEGELRSVRDERTVTVAHAIDVLLADAEAVKNFRTHRVERGTESWEFTIRRANGKTPSEIIDALRAKLQEAEERATGNRQFAETVMANCDAIVSERDTLRAKLYAQCAECLRVAEAIGSVEFMDPPDGGNVPLSEQVRRMRAKLDALADMEKRKDDAYEERNRVVSALARAASLLGYRALRTRTAIEGWSDDWHGCVRIDLPTGQVSWHFHDSHAHLFAWLPEGEMDWDGHDTPEKYRRVQAFAETALAVPPERAELVKRLNARVDDALRGEAIWTDQKIGRLLRDLRDALSPVPTQEKA